MMLRNEVLATVMFAALGAAGCKSPAREADRAADEVVAKRKALDQQTADRASELGHATAVFEERKELRVMGLRTERAMIAPQSEMIGSLADQLPLTAQARRDIDQKLTVFAQKLDDVDAKLGVLKSATTDQWSAADDAMSAAMKDLESARDDAWSTFRKAKRTDRSSS